MVQSRLRPDSDQVGMKYMEKKKKRSKEGRDCLPIFISSVSNILLSYISLYSILNDRHEIKQRLYFILH